MLDLLLDMSFSAFLVFDENGKVLRANQAAADMFGLPVEELPGMEVGALMPERLVGKHAKLFQSFLADNVSRRRMGKQGVVLARRRNGEEFPAEASIGKIMLDGKTALVVSMLDVSMESRAGELVRKTTDSLQRRLMFEELTSHLATKFMNASIHEVHGAIQDTLGRLGEFFEVDRVYIFEFAENGSLMNNTYEWCAENISPQIENLQGLPSSMLPWWMEFLNKRETIVVPRVSEMPPEAAVEQEILAAQDIQSVLVTPMLSDSGLFGFLGFDSVRHERNWTTDEVKLLGVLSGLITNTIIRQRSQRDLLAQRDFAQTITTQMGQGLTVTGPNGRFEFVNPSYAGMLGYEPEALIGRTPFDVTFPEDREILAAAQSGLAGGEFVTYEMRLQGKDNRDVYTLVTSAPRITDGRYGGAITVITDLTERRRMEQQLRAYADDIERSNIRLADARDKALEASQLKSAFLATMSHEIRTPMNAIMGMTELLLDTNLNDEQREFAQTLDSSTRSLMGILNDILDFSKIEAGKLAIRPVAFNPVEMAEGTIRLFQSRAQEKNIDLSLAISTAMPQRLFGDADRIRQILNNLISNAVKFTPAQGKISIEISVAPVDKRARIMKFLVRDNGIGISESKRATMFEPFTQADASNTRKYGGTGLGLAISKRLVELMCGEIGFESVEGAGSTFWFSLPLALDDHAKKNVRDDSALRAARKKQAYAGVKPVLLVEDNLVNRDLLALQLREFGLAIRHAKNGSEAVDLFQADPASYSLVLMDLNMPIMDGLTAARLMRQVEAGGSSHIPIVALTADAMSDSQESSAKAGMDDFVSKPVSLKDLDKLLAKWLGAPGRSRTHNLLV